MATRMVLTDTETGSLDGKVRDWLFNLFQRKDSLDVSGAFAGDVLQTRGASWIQYGSYDTEPFPTLLPAALGFTSIVNCGQAGRRAQDNAQIMFNSANPLAFDTAFVGPVLLHEPGNNLIEADTPANRRAALESVRAMVALMSASRRVEQTGWTWKPNANGENWNDESAQPYASGGTIRAGFFTGLQVDIPVPAGTSYLLCHGTDATKARGATIRVTQGGQEIVTKSLDGLTVVTPNEASNGVSPVAVRLPNLTAGTVTVTVDQAGLAGSVAIIDALLPQASVPRLVVLVKPTTLRSAAHDKPELLAYFRTVADTIRAEFGAHVLVVDPEPGWNPVTMLGEDGLHPTRPGAEHVRDAIVAAVRSRIEHNIARVVTAERGAGAASTGDKGPTGDAGAKGPTGDPGAKGSTGDKGAPGDKGATGDKGPAGDAGTGSGYTDVPVVLSDGQSFTVRKFTGSNLCVWFGQLTNNTGASIAAGTTLGTIPAGVRPRANLRLSLVSFADGAITGRIVPNSFALNFTGSWSAGSTIHMGGVSYIAEG